MTKVEGLLRLSSILQYPSIKPYVDEIEAIWEGIIEELSYEEHINAVSQIKDKVQREANMALSVNKNFGLVTAATGVGKTKMAIDKAIEVYEAKRYNTLNVVLRVLVVVPTEKLRDIGWKEEFDKWSPPYFYSRYVETTCYASLHTYDKSIWDLIILDEVHNITELSAEFFKKNSAKAIVAMTATKPRSHIKQNILTSLGLEVVYDVSLDEAVKLGIVAPYDVTVVTMSLDTQDKYITAGSKAKPFMQTERGMYNWLSKKIGMSQSPKAMDFIARMRFLYNCKSKMETARLILQNVIPVDLRTLIFCGSKHQANQLCEHRFYSKPTPPKKPAKLRGTFGLVDNDFEIASLAKLGEYAKYVGQYTKYQEELKEYQGNEGYNLFTAETINRLSCVNALNEGQNISNLDVAFVVQLDSSPLKFIQRIGRVVRFRPGHTGKIIVLAYRDTVDALWVDKAIARLDKKNVRFITLEDLRVGKETITFNNKTTEDATN